MADRELHKYRVEMFVKLGFSDLDAATLADGKVDWHEAEKLLAAGCDHATAVDILRPA